MSFRLPRFTSPYPRQSLKQPEREVALRTESIASSRTTLVLKSKGDDKAAIAYSITTEQGQTVYTVSGRKYGDQNFREFHDASGLPLFELHTKTRLGFPSGWYLTMPGGGDVKIAEGGPRLSMDKGGKNMRFSFRNMATNEAKAEDDKFITLDVAIESYGQIMAKYDINDGDRKIAWVYESVQHNDVLALMPSSRRKSIRPAVDLVVAAGVDTLLVSLNVVEC
ncbi:hypothetical protein N7478_009860 [Penicillium angulare]|uniref:uncharacterized protein n=1 Tax=Penicillium angulare TaxID=116970 RepID=UPI0025400872|nr:uncharacterized protein N7478_009860 [Penicillium angulare]KAJ5267052.1 hypothetical protein N7478_009860 [Penicillium angulare]